MTGLPGPTAGPLSAAAPAPPPTEASGPTPATQRRRGIPPLPLLTVINFFNYLDRQVVYGMTPFIGREFHLSLAQLGMLATVNLLVFAVASLASGPIADRIGPRKVIFAGILVWAIARVPAMSHVQPPRKCRMLTPRSNPSRLTRMNSEAGPWNHVAVIHASSCQTVANRSQSPASRQSAQLSMTSRMASVS